MLAQMEADSLIAMSKEFSTPRTISMPPGTKQMHDLVGEDGREQFILDLWRATIRLSKCKYQMRGRVTTVLVRLDVDGAPHTNPDDERIDTPHLHRYREGFDDKWATPVDPNAFSEPLNMAQAFGDFCRYCHISNAPAFQGELL